MYSVSIRYSKNGKSWLSTTKHINAESDMSAIQLAKSMYSRYPYVEVTRCQRIH